jgi:thiol-disulfide isomerase/thioredoxin
MLLPKAVPTLLILALVACASTSRSGPAVGLVGRPIALAAIDLQGRRIDVAADRGKVRVIDFWATWCEPCRDELPELDRLAGDLGGRGLAVYAVSFDESASAIPDFLREVPVRFPVLWDKGGETWAPRFGIERLPTTLLVDRRGTVRFVHAGWDERIAVAERRELEHLLNER